MLAIKGTYNKGRIDLETIPPTNQSDVIVVFTDVPETSTNNKKLDDEEQTRNLFNKFTGSINEIIDYKAEKLEALDEKYKSTN